MLPYKADALPTAPVLCTVVAKLRRVGRLAAQSCLHDCLRFRKQLCQSSGFYGAAYVTLQPALEGGKGRCNLPHPCTQFASRA